MSKRTKQFAELVDKDKDYSIAETVDILKKAPHPKFDETVDLAISLDIDPKQTNQIVRGTVVLPHGTGKKVRVAVFCKGEAKKQAEQAGADFVGDKELVDRVNSGWLDFDVAVSTPEMMREVGKLGKVLGPRGLMPSPKAGTVTNDINRAVKELKAGKIEFKTDKQGNICVGIGKVSFGSEKLCENADVVVHSIVHARPQSIKGKYIKSVYLSTTMGPGVRVKI